MRPIIFLSLFLLLSCASQSEKGVEVTKEPILTTDAYTLFRAPNPKALLVLFPGGGQTATETNLEFPIAEKANAEGISVLMMNFNLHLFINEDEAKELSSELEGLIAAEGYQDAAIVIGGFSMGGNVALSLSNFLLKTGRITNLKGVFIVDSPIDLYALITNANRNLVREDLPEELLAEPRWIVDYFEGKFGNNDSTLAKIQEVSPFALSTKSERNIDELKGVNLRFYTEPDSLWWKTNRMTAFENTNSYIFQMATRQLQAQGWENLELIETKNKGYRANGERHPHSWSIVDKDEMIQWILD